MAETKNGIDLNVISSIETETLFDIMDNEEKANTSTFVKGYCLYKHITNRPPVSPTSPTNEKTVMKFLKDESSLNKNFSLSLMSTDLKTEQEAKLQDFLIKRLSRSTIYTTTGSIATLSNTDISEKPVMCYYKLIRGPKDAQKASNNEEIESGSCSLAFLVCFVVSESSNLYLFQQELERFCTGYEERFSNIIQTELDTSEIFKTLADWYHINVLYVCRCTKLFQLGLSSLISMGLLDQKLSVTGCDKQRKEDVNRFVDVCSLSNLLNNTSIKESNHKLLEDLVKGPTEVNELTFSNSDFKFNLTDKEDICEVCNDWAKTMVEGEQDNPVFLRQVMENYKVKVIQDMNSLKRLLREAETDNYALFRSYIFLSKCPSSRILMEHIRHEAKMSMTKDICDVIEVLDDFIAEKGGFTKIRSLKQ